MTFMYKRRRYAEYNGGVYVNRDVDSLRQRQILMNTRRRFHVYDDCPKLGMTLHFLITTTGMATPS